MASVHYGLEAWQRDEEEGAEEECAEEEEAVAPDTAEAETEEPAEAETEEPAMGSTDEAPQAAVVLATILKNSFVRTRKHRRRIVQFGHNHCCPFHPWLRLHTRPRLCFLLF